jgi:hypothetical protein
MITFKKFLGEYVRNREITNAKSKSSLTNYVHFPIVLGCKTHTKSLKPWYRDWIITDSYVVLFSNKNFLRKNICCYMILPLLPKNRPIFVSRLKLTSPIKNCILSKGDNMHWICFMYAMCWNENFKDASLKHILWTLSYIIYIACHMYFFTSILLKQWNRYPHFSYTS